MTDKLVKRLRDYDEFEQDYVRADLAFPAVQPDARELALREAAALAEIVSDKWREEDGMAKDTCRRVAAAILSLLDKPAVQPAHVNEMPKREHVPDDVLTRAAKGIAHD